jgi:hypothetical protein
MQKMHLVMMENDKSDFKYFLGVFSTGSKAESAAKYEMARRRADNIPGKCTPRVLKIEVDKMTSPLSINALEELELIRS